MIKKNKNKFFISLIIISSLFIIDRITKLIILNFSENNQNFNIEINNYLNFIIVWNEGIGFGLLSYNSSLIYNIVTVLIAIINITIFYLMVNSQGLRFYSFLLILGGALGNLFDRIYYSAVPDFIDLNYNDFHWFIFNVADIFITVGIICLICAEFLDYKKK